MAIGLQVGNRARRDTALHRGLGHRRRHGGDQPRIEWRRDQIVWAKADILIAVGGGDHIRHVRARQIGDGSHAGQLHVLVDRRRADIQRPAKDEGKAQDVVHLIWIVAAPGCDDAIRPDALGIFGTDLRIGIGHRQDDRLRRHAPDHLGRQRARGGQAEEYIRPVDHLVERPRGRCPAHRPPSARRAWHGFSRSRPCCRRPRHSRAGRPARRRC